MTANLSHGVSQGVGVGNRFEIMGDLAAALLRGRGNTPAVELQSGLLRREVEQRYLAAARGLPGIEALVAAAQGCLSGPHSDGYLVLGCGAVLDACEDEDAALGLLTVVLSVLGTPLRVFDKWNLWKPLTSRLDVDPMRAFGVGYNPLHLDLVNTTAPPDYSGLLCVRPDPLGGGFSLASQTRRAVARLDEQTRRLLCEPVYRDGTFYDLSGVGEEYNPFPIIDSLPARRGFVRFTAKMLTDRDPTDPSTRAARALERELVAGQRRFRLESGDLLLINQHLTCHGREPLGSGQERVPEASRRELRQVFVRTRPETHGEG